ncbi:hypothetical protein JTB14_009106 [Gonioctena quinquepunctata]|nr:hypothetical protein JTB14_009106 [Gonioctena quinquepunctata]
MNKPSMTTFDQQMTGILGENAATQSSSTMQSTQNSGTETTSFDLQTTGLAESDTVDPETSPFSTWTPILSTIREQEKEEQPMPLSTWRPNLSSTQQPGEATSQNNFNISSSTTPLATMYTSIETQSPYMQHRETTETPEENLPLTTYQKIESNKHETTLGYTDTTDDQFSYTTTFQFFGEDRDPDKSSSTESIMQQETKQPGTTTEGKLTTYITSDFEHTTTDSTFIGSIQELLSQTLYDVGGLLSNGNDNPEMQNILNMTKIPSSKVENENTSMSVATTENYSTTKDITEISITDGSNSLPTTTSKVVSRNTESTVDFHTTLHVEENTVTTESISTGHDNQTQNISQISSVHSELTNISDKPVLLNITILNIEKNKNGPRFNITHQQNQTSAVPAKNTKTDKESENSPTTMKIPQDFSVITNHTVNPNKATFTTEITIERSTMPSVPSTQSVQKNKTDINLGSTEKTNMKLEYSTDPYPSSAITEHPSVEITISENKTNNLTEKKDNHGTASTNENLIQLNANNEVTEAANSLIQNKVENTGTEHHENETISTQTNSSSESKYQTTEESPQQTTNKISEESSPGVQQKNATEANITTINNSPLQINNPTTEKVNANNIIQTANDTKINSSLQNNSTREENYQTTPWVVKVVDNQKPVHKDTNSTRDEEKDWTLLPTIAPHSSVHASQDQPPPPSYVDYIAPASPIDLKAKPMQGFGLEDSTTSLDVDIYQFTQLCNELAFSFWKTVTSELSSARSVFLSPFGSMSLLAMIFLGARGSTSGEMNEILKLDDMETFNPHLIFKDVSESISPEEPDSGIVNSAMVRELFSDKFKGKLLPFYKERARAFYDGFVEDVNFGEIADVIRRRTNLQVKKYTKGRIREFLKTASTVRSPLAGVSVNVFQTDCSKTSTDGRDGELHFVVLPSIRQRRLVPIPAVVYKSGFLAGYEPSLDATAVSLGTKDQTVSTIFVIPGQQGMPAPGDGLARLEKSLVESSFKKGAWSRLLRSLIPREGLEVQIPRIGHRSVINATSALRKMGIRELFDKEKADLRGMNGIPNELFLSDLLQINSFSTCGEVGVGDKHHAETYPAEAPRGSRLLTFDNDEEMPENDQTLDNYRSNDFIDPIYDASFLDLPLPARPRQARVPEIPRLRFDRPFLYFVRHNPTGLILHIGRFNPRLLP